MNEEINRTYRKGEEVRLTEAKIKQTPNEKYISKIKENSNQDIENKNVEIETGEKKRKININELFLGSLTLFLGILHFIGVKTKWMDFYIMEFGEIDLEMIEWGTYNLNLTLKDAVLVGGTLLLGLIFLLTLPKKKEESEGIEIYIENSAEKKEENKKKEAEQNPINQKKPNLNQQAKL